CPLGSAGNLSWLVPDRLSMAVRGLQPARWPAGGPGSTGWSLADQLRAGLQWRAGDTAVLPSYATPPSGAPYPAAAHPVAEQHVAAPARMDPSRRCTTVCSRVSGQHRTKPQMGSGPARLPA